MSEDEERKAKARELAARAKAEGESARDEAAVAGAIRFLRAGGTISWDRWGAMSPASQAVFDAAGRVVALERANLIAKALAALRPASQDPVDAGVERMREACRIAMREGGRG